MPDTECAHKEPVSVVIGGWKQGVVADTEPAAVESAATLSGAGNADGIIAARSIMAMVSVTVCTVKTRGSQRRYALPG